VDKYIKFYARTAGLARALATIEKPWGPGTPQIEVIRDVAETLLLPIEFIGDFSDHPKAIKGRVICAPSVACMNDLAELHNFVWTMSASRLTIIRRGPDGKLAKRDTPPHIVSASTGMVGSPQVLIRGIEVAKKLDPA